ncbi:protein NRT1/ PTR FAMILY 5.10 [Sesamum angolense]|uniref:Protein NRT1/ PTR FAMILY 5.10 n=1 Tax=Sesamum angolense TaxID=2727404 RepID=A0AAE2BMW4_9LAMI|nr:protein NRT1/ PTR FAMILY 5.10 [Sesamum angolense]
MLFLTGSVPIFLPLYDRVFVPITRAITKKPSGISTLQRIGTGFVLSLISITSAALVEQKRLALAREYELVDMPNAMIPMSVWWLVPQYLISGAADVFGLVGLQEFFYDQVPGELKSIGLAMYLSILGVGSLLSSFLVSTVQELTSRNGQGGWFADNLNRAHLDYFYWLLAGLCAAELTAFCTSPSISFTREERVCKIGGPAIEMAIWQKKGINKILEWKSIVNIGNEE